MASNVKLHPIDDNHLLINNKIHVGLGVSQIIVGVENPNETEILVDPSTNLNYARTKVEGQEIYNAFSQKHGAESQIKPSPWFILDLETGKRGWFPGCIIRGDILENNVPLKNAPSDDAETIEELQPSIVRILNIDAIDQEPYDEGWYKVKFDVEGYVKKAYLTNIRYADPTKNN